jgi:diguanylate cyclase (GGDEF)-like protein
MAAGRFDTPTLYRSVIDALNYRRNNPVVGAPGEGAEPTPMGGTPGGAPATSDALASALSTIQGDEKARSALREQRSVRNYLSQHQADLAGLEGTQGFEPNSMNQLDLVDNLFTDISTEVDVTPDLRPIVGDLQVPLAKLALLEPQFFADKEHPARGVIDKVTQLASSSNYPNKALEMKVTSIIDSIVGNYKNDSTVFQSALDQLQQLVDQQQKALERNVERIVKTQDGQEKLRKAEKAVEKVLKTRVRPPRAPKPIVDLVNSGWRDLLKLTFVKQGPNSRAWKDYVKTLDLLSLWLMQKQTGSDDEQVQVERALEAEPLLDMVRQQISEALPTHVEHEAVLENLKEVLAGRAELEYVEVEPPPTDDKPAAAELRKKVEKLPRLRRWVRRVEDLERGTWLTYRDPEGARRRMQLAWVNDERDRFIFVNERGQKVADVSGVELARKLSRGVRPPSPAEELPLVDQSMYKTLEHVQKSLSFELNHDSLTRLINRETFIEQLDQALDHAKSKHSVHALLYIDIDRFGIVNDVYNKEVGDQILVEFGRLLAQQHDGRISSARIDGDCFGVLLLERSLEQAIAHAESIRTDIENSPVSVEGENVSFTVSIGVTSVVDHCSSVEEILENGQRAAAEAKEKGGNRVAQYNEDRSRADAYKAEEAAAIKQIEETLDTKNFVLQAQPIAKTHRVDGAYEIEHYEILLAIRADDGALKSPVDFIASAERFGFMTQVDQWVVRQVFTWISQMMDEQKRVPNLAINLSGNSVTDDEFMEFLFEAISEYGVGTSKICFEITETGTINNMVKATDFVNEFKNIGCKFSIDDFGTGLASHSYLRDLPVDYVKIDGTFIKHIDTNNKDFAMAKSINDLAHFLGQETIAEFAESEPVIAKLQEIGVDYIQGWGVGKPEPLVELAEKLEMLEK